MVLLYSVFRTIAVNINQRDRTSIFTDGRQDVLAGGKPISTAPFSLCSSVHTGFRAPDMRVIEDISKIIFLISE